MFTLSIKSFSRFDSSDEFWMRYATCPNSDAFMQAPYLQQENMREGDGYMNTTLKLSAHRITAIANVRSTEVLGSIFSPTSCNKPAYTEARYLR